MVYLDVVKVIIENGECFHAARREITLHLSVDHDRRDAVGK